MSADGPPRERAGVGGGGEERDPVTREVKRGKDGEGGGRGEGEQSKQSGRAKSKPQETGHPDNLEGLGMCHSPPQSPK